ncbi:substrate-binding domain-containing protein [Yonghaparkia sp. Root332]|uniref:substrate-binding domain-containing protein n=1 Tax=Yonghaparkia sp. Root332 TaxID=1736516 RepID=UPI0006F537F1|nr:substrate-binding domain-containing protein [Yonghaparkia sp. Root332]KQV26258.1 sugar ABC transporter [Yonghaparkia sp. Root332]
MKSQTARAPRFGRITTATAAFASAALLLSGCAASADSGATEGTEGDDPIGVTLIVKTEANPFFVAMQEGAEAAAEEAGVELTFAAGSEDGDEASQITAIENAIARGDEGILIALNGPGVNSAIERARDAGLYVIALDTAPDPADVVDITFATDNRRAGNLIGSWAAAQLDGEKAVIALLDVFDDRIVSVDYNRDQGFLEGMGIDVADPNLNGDEAPTGTYSGGDYEIVGNEATGGAEDGGRAAMETLLSKNPDINIVYTINEPAAFGAYQALEAAGREDDALIVSVDGGCAGVEYVSDGIIDATAQQYPVDMARLGVEAIVELVETGEAPEVTDGLDFFDTGVALVTDDPVDGVESIDTAEASELCWG